MLFGRSRDTCLIACTRIGIRDRCQAHLLVISKKPASYSVISKNQDTCACPQSPGTSPTPRGLQKSVARFFDCICRLVLYPEREFISASLAKTYFHMLLTMLPPRASILSLPYRFCPFQLEVPFLRKGRWLLRPSFLLCRGVDSDSVPPEDGYQWVEPLAIV